MQRIFQLLQHLTLPLHAIPPATIFTTRLGHSIHVSAATSLCRRPSQEKRNTGTEKMALKAVHVSDVPNLGHVTETASPYSSRFSRGAEIVRTPPLKVTKFLVIGHRGNGMNVLQSSDLRWKAVKENTIRSFNWAGKYPVDFIEFDVQVTKDGCPIIFHDSFIYSEDNGTIYEKRVTDMSLSEFLSYGPQKEQGSEGKKLLRKTKDGKILQWSVQSDDSACTLQEAFEKVKPSLGFNIELKFDDHVVYPHDHLTHVLESILKVVFDHAKERPIIFSTFQPDAALVMKKLQNAYPVYFLTNGGNEIYYDARRNSLEEAIKLCTEGGLQGIVSEVRGIFRNPGAVTKIKELNISLLTYGKLNNVSEAVYIQHLMGIDGVIVDLVQEITDVVLRMVNPSVDEDEHVKEGYGKLKFSQNELTFLLKLIPELIMQQ